MKAVAIDGPAGAGKSTLARSLAAHLGYIYLDTGALYRAIGYKLITNNISCDDEKAVSNVLKDTKVSIDFSNGEQIVLLDGVNVNSKIRTPEVSMMASKCSALKTVREFLLEMQRSIAKNNAVVMDGRDIGTVVLPEAEVKIFLTASPEARAERRYKELIEKGKTVSLDEVLEDIKKRDFNDTTREIAPLKPAENSVIVDTTDLSLEESLEELKKQVQKILG